MEKREQLYEGKAKKVFATDDPSLCIVDYKDDATAFNGVKRGTIMGKGVINNRLTNSFMRMLEKNGIPTHFVEELSDRETLVKKVQIVPLEVIIRNISAGSFAKRYGVEEGIVFDAPTIEFSYKNDDLGDPLINSYHALALKLATAEEIDTIKRYAFRINELLKALLLEHGIELVDFKLEFGRLPDGTIVFASTSSEIKDRYFGAVRVYLSHDDGETWEKGALLSTVDGNLIREPALCLRPGGVIRMFTRTCPGATGWGDGVRSLVSYTAESRDGGVTWSDPEPTTILNNESKIDVLSWDDDTILMAYNNTPVADWHERSPLTLACSHDEGRTWHNLLDLAPAPGNKCQPAMCKGPDGRLHVIYMHRHTAIEHLVVELER